MPSIQIILGAILAVIVSFGIGFTTGDFHRGGVDKKEQQIEIGKANAVLFQKSQIVVAQQSQIKQLTEDKKNAIRNQSNDFLNSITRNAGMLNTSPSLPNGTSSPFGISGKKLRFSVSDAIFLNQFATDCAISESERNEVILKYQAVEASTK